MHIKAAVAEEERRLISERTKSALQAAKERGVRLGNQAQAGANKAAAAARDADLRPILEAMRDQTYREIAQALTDRGIKTPRGGYLEPGHGHAVDAAIGHHRLARDTPRGREKFLGTGLLNLNTRLQSR